MQHEGHKDADKERMQHSLESDDVTIPFLPASEGATNPYIDQPVTYPQGFQPAASSFGQGGDGQNTYENSAGQPTVPQGAFYPENVLPPHSSSLPAGPIPTPARPARKRFLIALAIVIVLLFLALGGFFLLPALTANSHPSVTAASTPVLTSTPATSASKNIVAHYLTQYRAGVRNQIAQSLHLTSNQLGTQLASGKTLSTIAMAQGFTTAQYQTFVTRAFHNVFQPAVTSNNLTQKQVNALITRMLKNPKVLDKYLAIRQITPATKATSTVVANQ